MVSILLGLQFPLFVCLAKIGERRPLRNLGTAEELFYRGFRNLFAVSDTILLHIRLNICRTQRRVNHMCSSKLSVNCEKAEKDTQR